MGEGQEYDYDIEDEPKYLERQTDPDMIAAVNRKAKLVYCERCGKWPLEWGHDDDGIPFLQTVNGTRHKCNDRVIAASLNPRVKGFGFLCQTSVSQQ